MTRLPSTSLNFTHIRSISPQSSLPTVPTASAPSSSPRFFGCLIASSTRWVKSSVWLITSLSERVSRQSRIDFSAPCVNSSCKRSHILKAVPGKKRSGVQTAHTLMAYKHELPVFWPFREDFLHLVLCQKDCPINMHRFPFFPAANVDQRNLLAGIQSLGNFRRRYLHFLLGLAPG